MGSYANHFDEFGRVSRVMDHLHIFAVHPFPPRLSWYNNTLVPIGFHDRKTQQQIVEIAQRAQGIDGARIILGDFNMSDQARAFKIVSRHFQDVYRQAGKGFGFTFPHGLRVADKPVPGPFVRLDHIWCSNDLYASDAYTRCGHDSDHCYLVAELASMVENR